MVNSISKLLENISYNNDYESPLTSVEFLNCINKDGYDLLLCQSRLENYLSDKLLTYNGKKEDFQIDCLLDYASMIIGKIKEDYAPYLNKEAIDRLNKLLLPGGIKLFKKETDSSHKDITGMAHTDGTIEIAETRIDSDNFIKEVRFSLDTLLHEIFHQTHRYKIGKDLNYSVNGENRKASNYAGYIFEEGLTEKSALDFARKYGLSSCPIYEYNSYVNMVTLVEEALKCSNGDLFNQGYNTIFNKIDRSGTLLRQYEFMELSRYTSSNFKRHNSLNNVRFLFDGMWYNSINFPELDKNSINNKKDNNKFMTRTLTPNKKGYLSIYQVILLLLFMLLLLVFIYKLYLF